MILKIKAAALKYDFTPFKASGLIVITYQYTDLSPCAEITPDNKEQTRERLLLAGEKLIAENGIEGVSLRQVGIEAGQKNTSAALYHFSHKEGLLLAIFEYRMAHVDQRRHQLLDKDDSSIRALIKAWVLPDLEEITSTKGGSYHARFLAVASNHPALNFSKLWTSPYASSYMRIAKGLKALLPKMPETIFYSRFGMAMIQSIYNLADQERLRSSKSKNAISEDLFIHQLIDVMEGIFIAPISTETKKQLKLAKPASQATTLKKGYV
ncbi:TetR/AcrR family transcriptional regulator [Oceanicoccus sagamiensis]|uniref:HTH tetR-type domain-containing protein n=1 Tax=Oceanicoccus sagamiensis TaxID=716816 RepID=A0A1X9N541_9GAMM|nr:TetR/AcrR family transcriptional regulator [Oceanicoccus sagamiensis]ARN73230.1 hypothetical protein BST96_03375 [Oceanicoccus sagamiensis]